MAGGMGIELWWPSGSRWWHGRGRKVMVVDRSPGVRSLVLDLLRLGWSPASIAGRLAQVWVLGILVG
jgi:hypothetical protein